MSLHQIIYTSCMRGINGVNDGQQVYSYDATFKEATSDDVKRLFTYQPPMLDAGVIMTEELALTFPKAFTYRRLAHGAAGLALNTYLGRDYMGSAGRFGNHLSHIIYISDGDLQAYPCEYFGTGSLRDHMEYHEVNNPNTPDFLPQPTLERGMIVDVDAVSEFLSVEDRMDVLKNMIHAVLSFESERKRVVICDQPENIIMWIAAIEYALPLKTALGINFTTYEFDPSLSSSQICGVIPKGTRYAPENRKQHFTFDLYDNVCAEFDKDEHFYDFIDTSLSFSYDSLQDFHQFVERGYTYDKADRKMYAAFRLYSLLSDGLTGLSVNEFTSALEFAAEYARPAEKSRIIQTLLSQKDDLLGADGNTFLHAVRYLLDTKEALTQDQLLMIKRLLINKALIDLINTNASESEFKTFFEATEALCRENGVQLTTELAKLALRQNLLDAMPDDVEAWKLANIVSLISKYVIKQRLPENELLIDAPLGQTYYSLVKAAYAKNPQDGFLLVTRILDAFAADASYLVNMTLNIEGMLLDLPNGMREAANLQKYFAQAMIKHQIGNFMVAYGIFGKYQRYDQIYMLYSAAMAQALPVSGYQRLFEEQYHKIIAVDVSYAQKYQEQILQGYYAQLKNAAGDDAWRAKKELFYLISTKKLDPPFAEALVGELTRPIPLHTPTPEHRDLIQKAFEYQYNHLQKPIKGKLLLLLIAVVLEKCSKHAQLQTAFDKLDTLTQTQKGDLSALTDDGLQHYFDWILPGMCELCKTSKDLARLYSLFTMRRDISVQFFSYCLKFYLKQSKDTRSNDKLCEYMGFVFEKGNPEIRDNVGSQLSKFNRQRLADLDEDMKKRFAGDASAMRFWNEIKDKADSSSPLFGNIANNITNLFKKKK